MAEESMLCDENGKSFPRTNKFDMDLYNKILEEGMKESGKDLNVSTKDKAEEFLKLKKDYYDLFVQFNRLIGRHETLREENAELQAQIEKMKNCQNCKKQLKNIVCIRCKNNSEWEFNN